MVPKFANPHLLSQDVERTTRSEIAERAGFTSIVHDEDSHSLKRDLDILLRDTWGDTLAEASRAKKLWNVEDSRKSEDEQLTFRLVSSTKRPRRISLDPKPPPPPVSREPDCEDDETQAETRKIRSLSVAVECEGLEEASVSTRQVKVVLIGIMDVSGLTADRPLPQPVTIGAKIALTDVPLVGPLPSLLVTEEARARRTVRRAKNRGSQANEGFTASPHEPRVSCAVLPVMSVPNQREMSGKKHRKPVRERPPPAYWRPSPELRGKCMGYALGYPSSWASDQPYVRDTMKRGVESNMLCKTTPS